MHQITCRKSYEIAVTFQPKTKSLEGRKKEFIARSLSAFTFGLAGGA
jgi:hypothetical protein